MFPSEGWGEFRVGGVLSAHLLGRGSGGGKGASAADGADAATNGKSRGKHSDGLSQNHQRSPALILRR